MDIEIKNCNNIDNAKIALNTNQLNIKYGINGTGKSTIAKAIDYSIADSVKGTNSLSGLKQYKNLNNPLKFPIVIGTDSIKSVITFSESYINSFIFQPDELLKGSFDILIKDDTYQKGMEKINSLIHIMQTSLSSDTEIEALIADFNEISASFGKPTKSGIHGSGNLAKSFKDGNKVENIPTGLESYKTFIQHEQNYKWIKWQHDGIGYVDMSDECPYCVSNIQTKKETIKKISEVYDSKAIESLNRIVSTFQRLSAYFSDATRDKIDEFVKNVSGYNDEQINYLKEVRDQIDRLKEKFIAAKYIGFSTLKDVEKVIDALNEKKIDIDLYNHLKSEQTVKKVKIVNDAIDILLKTVGELQGAVIVQRKYIEKLVSEHSSEINLFLKNSGMKYSVSIIADEKDEDKLKLKLVHQDITGEVENVRDRLSYGERNAFALILFAYNALKNNPDLIILDDPISSFDKNKKYAIVDFLFKKEKFFRGKSVLLLTHDFEPVVDLVFHHRDKFSSYATFLENNNGTLSEKSIKGENIKTFVDVNLENSKDKQFPIGSLVYLRRYLEITDKSSLAYHMLSSLLHKRDKPKVKQGSDSFRDMSESEISEANKLIKLHNNDFNYNSILATLKDDAKLKELYKSAKSNYEKLHIFRIFYDDKTDAVDSDVIMKFINESFHIETDYIYQLNPKEYSVIPHYIIEECSKSLGL